MDRVDRLIVAAVTVLAVLLAGMVVANIDDRIDADEDMDKWDCIERGGELKHIVEEDRRYQFCRFDNGTLVLYDERDLPPS